MTNGPDNAELLFKRLDDLVAEIIDRFANEGHRTVTVIETLQDVIAKHRLAYDRDPIRLKTSRSQRTIGPPRRAPSAGANVQSRYLHRPADLHLSGPRADLMVASVLVRCSSLRAAHLLRTVRQKVGLARSGRRTQPLETIDHRLDLPHSSIPAAAFANLV
ncbi:hypothetical protein [Rhizobium skierniewicense]|uniref:hypothetical protein n=1 Tax=Rhizobium skierniewicense TaxID=984260 RepID=UPI001571E79F|nr:hypothetical protein [Rhizobium skierniewicense]NTF34996.1 hypothetical protein [Rhizobium skierniewicense]